MSTFESLMVFYSGVNCLVERCRQPNFRSHWILSDYSERTIYSHFKSLVHDAFSKDHTIFQPSIQFYGPELLKLENAVINSIGTEFKDVNIRLSIHGDNFVFPVSSDPNFKKEISQLFAIGQQLNASDIVVHLPMKTGNIDSDIIENLILVLEKSPDNCSLNLENKHHQCYYGNLDHFSTLLQKFDETVTDRGLSHLKSKVNICFDFGHYIIQATEEHYPMKEMLANFFLRNDSRLRMFHLHLNDGTFDHHILPDEYPFPQEPYVTSCKPDFNRVREFGVFLKSMLPLINWNSSIERWIIGENEHPFTSDILASSFTTLQHWMLNS